MKNHLWLVLRGTRALLLCLWVTGGASVLAQEGAATPADSDGLLLEVTTDPAQIYLHETVSLTVTLLTGAQAVRNIQYPRLTGTGFTLAEFGLPRQRTLGRDGRDFSVYQFTTTLTPTRSGELRLGPAELGCELLAPAAGPAAFYGSTEARRVTLRSTAIPLTVLPLPLRGRPAGFSGAVGRFSVTRSALPAAVQAGEPVTVRTVIRGTGNLQAFACDPVSAPGLQNYPPHRELGGASLVCEQVVIPDSPAVREIPAVTVHFFDPRSQRYRSSAAAALALQVTPLSGPVAVTPPAPPGPVPPRPPAAHYPVIWPVGLSAGLLLAAGIGGSSLARRHRRRPVTAASNPDPMQVVSNRIVAAEAALAAGDADLFYTALFRAWQSFVGAKLHLSATGLTGPLPTAGLSAADYRSVCTILSHCDRARFGRHIPVSDEMSADLQMMRKLVEGPAC